MEYLLSAGASLLQEFCVLNWLGPAEKDATNVRFGWKVEKAEWVSSSSVISVVYDFYNCKHCDLHVTSHCVTL